MKFNLSTVTSFLLSSKNKLLNNLCRYFKRMKSIPFLLITAVSILLFSMTVGTASPLFAQQNETGIATIQTGEAGQTAMNQTGEAGQTAMNQTGEALTNASESDVAQNISQGGQEVGQTVANETGDIFGSISEGLKGLFGMK
jgi:predicted PurR-regulated permease PerM